MKKKSEAPNKRAHNQQEEKQEESWRTQNITGNKSKNKMRFEDRLLT